MDRVIGGRGDHGDWLAHSEMNASSVATGRHGGVGGGIEPVTRHFASPGEAGENSVIEVDPKGWTSFTRN